MRLTINDQPCIVHESALLAELAFKHKIGERELIINDPSKYGMTRSDVEEKYGLYIDYRQAMLDEIVARLDDFEELEPYMVNEEGDPENSIFTEGVITWVEDLKFFTYEVMKKFSLRLLYKQLVNEEVNLTDDEIEQLDYKEVYKIVENLAVSAEKKMKYMGYFYNLDSIYEKYYELLEFTSEVFNKHYHKIEPLVTDLVDKRKESGSVIESLSDINFSLGSDIDLCETVAGMTTENLRYYVSPVNYKMLTFSMPVEKYSRGIVSEGLLVSELLSL